MVRGGGTGQTGQTWVWPRFWDLFSVFLEFTKNISIFLVLSFKKVCAMYVFQILSFFEIFWLLKLIKNCWECLLRKYFVYKQIEFSTEWFSVIFFQIEMSQIFFWKTPVLKMEKKKRPNSNQLGITNFFSKIPKKSTENFDEKWIPKSIKIE